MKNNLLPAPKPFLRWAGGKTWLTKHFENFLPDSFNNYYEPFLGGASIFIFLKSHGYIQKKAFLSDINDELINTYQSVKRSPNELINTLSHHVNNEKYYYKVRSQRLNDQLEKASRFIFLNRTSFNGIYRENLKGEYNVPYGRKNYKTLFEIENILSVSKLLQNTHFSIHDFEKATKKVKAGDLVFLDPPYTVAHENNGFVKYNQKLFSWDDQIRLQRVVQQLSEKKAYFILTNAAHKSIRELYAGIGNIKTMQRASQIGGIGAKREQYKEFIITNF